MTDHDIAINPVGAPNIAALTKKPPHLVSVADGKLKQLFLSLDKPELLDGFIQVKGFFVSESDSPNKEYVSLLSSTPKESYVEILLPIHRVLCIQNLMFKAK